MLKAIFIGSSLAVLALLASTGAAPAHGEDINLLEKARKQAAQQPPILGQPISENQASGPAGENCPVGQSQGTKVLCELFGASRTQEFVAFYGTGVSIQAADEKIVSAMFSNQNPDAVFFEKVFSALPPQHWAFVIALERARESIVQSLGKGNIFSNGLENLYITCDKTKCDDREAAVAEQILTNPDRFAWNRFAMTANISKYFRVHSEHTAGCYSYSGIKPDSKDPIVEVTVDAYRNVVEDPAKWWKDNDLTAYDGLTRQCGGHYYCSDCACLYEAYAAFKAYKHQPAFETLSNTYKFVCPDTNAGSFVAAEAAYGPAMRQEFGF